MDPSICPREIPSNLDEYFVRSSVRIEGWSRKIRKGRPSAAGFRENHIWEEENHLEPNGGVFVCYGGKANG